MAEITSIVPTHRPAEEPVLVRRSRDDDVPALSRLAALDSRRLPACDMLVAEAGGELLAAITLDGRDVIANPFRPTADLVTLLRLRADQIAAARRRPSERRPRGILRLRPRPLS
jgi:hypothetical protein